VSLPSLISKLNVPEDVFLFEISHLKLSTLPLSNTPLAFSAESLFMIVPSPKVSIVNALPLTMAPTVLPEIKWQKN
jgi:hypothetical protein